MLCLCYIIKADTLPDLTSDLMKQQPKVDDDTTMTANCMTNNLALRMMLMSLVSQRFEHADTSDIKLLPGKNMNDKMVYPSCENGKFKYCPENEDVIDYVMH
jgi:hypothetical protein